MNIVLAGTGSVAAIKYWRLCNMLKSIGDVKCVLTEKGQFFADKGLSGKYSEFESFAYAQDLYTEKEEWDWDEVGDPIPHIDLKDWGDVLVIAPLSANTLTKMALGICDNLLTSMYYAWPRDKNVVVAPAMNTNMWNNPLTREHLRTLESRHTQSREPTRHEMDNSPSRGFFNFNYTPYQSLEDGIMGYRVWYRRFGVIDPVESNLACGVKGKGAMAPLQDIVDTVKAYGPVEAQPKT